MLPPKNIAIIGFGEAGTTMAEGCVFGARRSQSALACHAWDLKMLDPRARGELEARAASLGVTLHDSPYGWLHEMDVVFSVVHENTAKSVALDLLPWLRSGAAYIDLTDSDPDAMRETAEHYAVKNVGFIDGTALGSFRANGITVPFMLSGTDVEAYSSWMNSLGFAATPIPGGAGKASALKLLRGALTRGMEALAVECFTAAERLGLRKTLMLAFNDFDLQPMAAVLERLSLRHGAQCKNKLASLELTLELFDKAAINPAMTRAVRDFYARSAALPQTDESGDDPSWESCLPAFFTLLDKE